MEDVRIGLAQVECLVGDIDANIEKHRQFATRAAEAGARIVCFPELSLTGYPNVDALPHDLARSLEGEVAESLVALGVDTGVLVLAGLIERDRSGVLYNTQLVAGPDGLVGAYRKTHVGNSEIHRFSHGDDLSVFTCGGITFGIQICYDNHFPEASRTLALRGAEIIFCPYGSPGPCTEEGMTAKRTRWLRYLTARAFDNSIYMAVVNQVGPFRKVGTSAAEGPETKATPRDTHNDLGEFPGGSMVLNPWGEVIAKTEHPAEDLLIVDLTRAAFQDKRADALQFFTHFRRPELYGELVSPRSAHVSLPPKAAVKVASAR